MATQTVASNVAVTREVASAYERFAGICGVLAGICGVLYAIAFVVLKNPLLYSIFLGLGGILSSAVLVAVYERVHESEAGFSLWGLVLGLIGALGSTVHAGYDLANAINVPATIPSNIANLPSAIDPRGLLTFGIAGLGVLVFAWLMVRSGRFPKSLGYLGYLLAVLLLIIYLARLIILDPANPILLVPVLLAGFLINPAWYIWLGFVLLQGRSR